MKKYLVITGLAVLMTLTMNCAFSQETNLEKVRTMVEIGNLVNVNNFDEALEKCDQALVKYPEEADLYRWRATIKSSKGNKEEAIKDFDKSLELKPDDDSVIVLRGVCKMESGDMEGAMADFNKAISINPKNSSAYSMRACLKLQTGDIESADEDFETSNKLYDESVKPNPQEEKK